MSWGLHLLADVIGQAQAPVWWPSLTHALVNAQLSDSEPYSTATENPSNPADHSSFAEIWPHDGGELRLRLEFLGHQQAKGLLAKGLNLYEFEDLKETDCLQTLSEALTLVAQVPSLSQSIQMLVKSTHLLRPDEPTMDTSFSEPRLPFSIFVSVPPGRIEDDASRVAEAIVHEAMHLQLSLVERQIPLIGNFRLATFSPWRGEIRDASGLLHALYVFRVIFDWLALMGAQIPRYASRRRREIDQQVLGVDWPCLRPALTPAGTALLDRLLQDLTVGA